MNTLHLDLLAQRTRCEAHIANLTRMAGAETGQARALLLSAAKQVINGMPMFRVDDGEPCTLADFLAANADDEAVCEWAQTAQPGDEFPALVSCQCVAP